MHWSSATYQFVSLDACVLGVYGCLNFSIRVSFLSLLSQIDCFYASLHPPIWITRNHLLKACIFPISISRNTLHFATLSMVCSSSALTSKLVACWSSTVYTASECNLSNSAPLLHIEMVAEILGLHLMLNGIFKSTRSNVRIINLFLIHILISVLIAIPKSYRRNPDCEYEGPRRSLHPDFGPLPQSSASNLTHRLRVRFKRQCLTHTRYTRSSLHS